jgi:integrase
MARERGLYQRKDSPYWWIDVVLPDGRRVCQSTRLKDRDAATEFLIRLKADAYDAQQKPLQPDRSWKEAVLRYVGELDNPSRLVSSRDHLRQLDPFLCELMLNEISMESLQPFIRHRKDVEGVTNATVNRALEIVRRILHLARDEWGWLERFPRIRMLSEPRRRVRFLSRREADALLEALSAHLRPVVSFGLATGCRMGEILNMEWHRVDFDRRVAWLDHGTTKNGEGRGIPLNNDAILALRAVEGDHGRWCFTYQGKRMERVGSGWKRALRRAGITAFRFHDLRHTWASWHVTNGTSLQELMELGGWKSYEMVLRYAHLAPDHLSHAAARIERTWEIVESNSTKTLR